MKLSTYGLVAMVLAGIAPPTTLVASEYPSRGIENPVVPINRPCTQLELGAKIAPEQCGHMSLSDVVKVWAAVNGND